MGGTGEGETFVPSPYYDTHPVALKGGRPPQVLRGGYIPEGAQWVIGTTDLQVGCPPIGFLG